MKSFAAFLTENQQWLKRLAPDKRSTLMSFIDGDESTRADVAAIIRRAPNYSGTIYRGVADEQVLAGLTTAVGSTGTAVQVMSATTLRDVAEKFATNAFRHWPFPIPHDSRGVLFVLRIRTGVDIHTLADDERQTEGEVLIRPGTRFHVTDSDSTTVNGRPILIVHADEA